MACEELGERCFCTSVGLSPHATGGSDVIACETDEETRFRPLTDSGEKLIENLDGVVEAAPAASRTAAPARTWWRCWGRYRRIRRRTELLILILILILIGFF